jgi:hypothetical protein
MPSFEKRGNVMRTGKDLARYMQPSLEGGRLDRQWDAVQQLSHRERRWPWAAAGLAVAAAAVVVAVIAAGRIDAEPVALDGAVVETSGTNTQRLSLADGSTVELSQASRLQFAKVRSDEIVLKLTRGALSLSVMRDEKRAFTVSAGGFDVKVRGTRFRVELSEGPAPRLTVSVDEGRVEIGRSGSLEPPRAVIAGESWSSSLEVSAPARPMASPPAPPKADTKHTAQNEPVSNAPPAPSVTETEGPRRLLELADAARLGGHPRDAAVALDKLRRTYRTDPRAGLAALELGRLRSDSFGDLGGALEAFRDAAALASSGSVREDADARTVQTLERLGDRNGCMRARDAYLTRFPNGIHAATMRGRCNAP